MAGARRARGWALGLLLLVPAWAQSEATPAQRDLQAPLALEDGKPTPAAEAPPSGWRTLGSLTLVVGLAGLSLWGLRKVGRRRLPGGGGGRLRVEETLALGDRRFLSIVGVEGQRLLVALTPQGLSLLARLDGEPFDATLAREAEAAPPVPLAAFARRWTGEDA